MAKLNSIIVIDVETGGLSPKKNPITQVAYQAFQLSDYKPILQFSSYVKPYNNLSLEDAAMKYTGITYADLEAGLDSKEIVKKLKEDFAAANTSGSHTKKPILLGHNIGFDIGFICYLFELHKVDITKYLSHNHGIPVSIDTMSLAKQKWGSREFDDGNQEIKYNLSDCVARAGVPITDAHDAMNDVIATKELFFYFNNYLRNENELANKNDVKQTRVRNHFKFTI